MKATAGESLEAARGITVKKYTNYLRIQYSLL